MKRAGTSINLNSRQFQHGIVKLKREKNLYVTLMTKCSSFAHQEDVEKAEMFLKITGSSFVKDINNVPTFLNPLFE